MKKYIYYIATLAAAFMATSCAEMMNDARDAEIVEPIKVAYTVDIKDFTAPDGTPATAPADWFTNLEAVFNNFSEGIETVVKVGSDGVAMAEVIPGVYNITVRSTQKYDGKSYILNGLAQNVTLTEDVTTVSDKYAITIQPLLGSPLCFREMYYAGSPGGYFRDQFGSTNTSALTQWVADNSWTEDNTNAILPRISFTNRVHNNRDSQAWVIDSRYVRLKNVEVGYTFTPKNSGSFFNYIRVYASGNNLLTFADFKGNDPEAPGSGLDYGVRYPMTRLFNIGAQFNF